MAKSRIVKMAPAIGEKKSEEGTQSVKLGYNLTNFRSF